jgi:RimJ/RimL family protein N-acetyltransferase
MELHTERLVLRPLRAEDALAIAEGCADPEVPRFIPHIPDDYGLSDAQAYVEQVEGMDDDDPERVFAIADPENDKLIGLADIRVREGGALGYWLAPEARGRGLATEAARALVEWATQEHGVRKLTLTAHPDNTASQRVAEKAGFRRVGLVPHPRFKDGTDVAEGFELDAHAPTPRLERRIREEFPEDADDIVRRMTELALPMAENQSRERILAAALIASHGDLEALGWALRMASRDWRDVLVGAGLANLDWPARLDAELGQA